MVKTPTDIAKKFEMSESAVSEWLKKKEKMSRLIINESPLIVLRSLALAVGLNEAIFIQQLYYWLDISEFEYEGRV